MHVISYTVFDIMFKIKYPYLLDSFKLDIDSINGYGNEIDFLSIYTPNQNMLCFFHFPAPMQNNFTNMSLYLVKIIFPENLCYAS
jgi:hypothetical protein